MGHMVKSSCPDVESYKILRKAQKRYLAVAHNFEKSSNFVVVVVLAVVVAVDD